VTAILTTALVCLAAFWLPLYKLGGAGAVLAVFGALAAGAALLLWADWRAHGGYRPRQFAPPTTAEKLRRWRVRQARKRATQRLNDKTRDAVAKHGLTKGAR
jgi:hypothetical protein